MQASFKCDLKRQVLQISYEQKTSRQNWDVFCSSSACFSTALGRIHRKFPANPQNLAKSPKIPGFSIFRVVCKHSTGIILKDTCAKVDTELRDMKSTANTVFDIQESNEGRNL